MPLFTNQISNYACNDKYICPHFVGVFPADAIQIRQRVGDRKFPIFFVANTDPSDKTGEHWVAFVILKHHLIEVFDSFGRPARAYSPHLNRFIKKFTTQRHNKTQFQSIYSDTCGYFCLYYLRLRGMRKKPPQIFNTFSRRQLRHNDTVVKRYVIKTTNRPPECIKGCGQGCKKQCQCNG